MKLFAVKCDEEELLAATLFFCMLSKEPEPG